MALTPLDIHHKEFKTARFGGYNEEEVDSFLDLVADELEKIHQENGDLRLQLDHLKQRLAEFEEMQSSLQSALLAATRSAEAVKEQARQESENIMLRTQKEADLLIGTADEQARQVQFKAQEDRHKLETEFARLKDIKKNYLQSIKEIAEEHLAQVDQLESADEKGAPVQALPFDVDKQPEEKAVKKAPKQRERIRAAGKTKEQPAPQVEETPLPKTESKVESADTPRPPRPPAFVEDMPIIDVPSEHAPESEGSAPPPEPPHEVVPEPAPEHRKTSSQEESQAAARVVIAPEPEVTGPAPVPRTADPFTPEPEATAPPPGFRTSEPPRFAPPESGAAAPPTQPLTEAHSFHERNAGAAREGAPRASSGQPDARGVRDNSVVESSLRSMSRQAPVTTNEVRRPDVDNEKTTAASSSSNLVQEVLAVDMEEDIYSMLEEDDSDESRSRGRRSRREKKEKHFFWE